MDQMYMQPHFDFEAHFPLSNDGGLDLDLVRETWGLETCVPIHPERYKPFNPGNNQHLSPLAIYTLSVRPSGCVCIMEPHVSAFTEVQRTCRRIIVDFVEGVTGLYQDTKRNTCYYVEYKTRLPRYYRAAQEKRKQFVSDYNQWHETWERKNGQGSVLMTFLLLFLFLFFLFIQSGYVEFRLRARMWAYIWTGSFKLPEKVP
ncbi:hypothetical protein M378DRAFT_1008665 [Amanita muscaria Koide BX008]|uniref:Uncharacterized protein n=1 Tax=Amanita muscaria (strain Koide BX008) TaxID=946122 RepID=A0A0C2WRK9_AMAMK|nr:hypothetical protein M378DRAFT_1008665 [Amanita muscaria Koide BX008]